MYVLVNMIKQCGKRVLLTINSVFVIFCLVSPLAFAADKKGLGKPATEREIQGWDIDIRPDGKGLPAGQGDAIAGEEIFLQKCASCHGEFAEGAGRYPALAGGAGSLDTHDPVKTVGSYWPYASTIFDYVRRAMPFGHAQSLTNDEVYAITAFILYSSEIIEDDVVMNQQTLPAVKMPNRDGFISGAKHDIPRKKPCMKNCLAKKPVIVGKARQIDVTPESEAKEEVAAATSEKGEAVFASQCLACHSMAEGENKFGPSLHAVVGRKASALDSYINYSAAMKSVGLTWSEDNLRQFLSAPQALVAGTSMPYGGLQNESELDSLILYLLDKGATK